MLPILFLWILAILLNTSGNNNNIKKKKIHPSQLNLAYDSEKQTLEAMSIYRLLGQYEDHNCPLKS